MSLDNHIWKGFASITSQNQRTTERFALEGTLNIISFQHTCHGQGHLPLDQVTQRYHFIFPILKVFAWEEAVLLEQLKTAFLIIIMRSRLFILYYHCSGLCNCYQATFLPKTLTSNCTVLPPRGGFLRSVLGEKQTFFPTELAEQ